MNEPNRYYSQDLLSSTRLDNDHKPVKKRRRVRVMDSDEEEEKVTVTKEKPLFQSSQLFNSQISSIRMSKDDNKTIAEEDEGMNSEEENLSIANSDDVKHERSRSNGSSAINTEDEEDVIKVYSDGEVDEKLFESLKKANGKTKRANQTPRAKLDHTRLLGQLGLSRLTELSKKIKVRGRGYEKEDLDSVMNIFKIWSHQMFPKMTYDQVIDKLELLGKKREVQMVLRQIREGEYTGPKTQSDEFVQEDNEYMSDNGQHGGDLDDVDRILKEKNEEFDRLFKELQPDEDVHNVSLSNFNEAKAPTPPAADKANKSISDVSEIEKKRLAALERLKAKKAMNSSTEIKNRMKDALGL